MKEIQIFSNPQFGEIRISLNEANEPMFCLSDVCKSLELTSPSKVKERLNQKGVNSIHTLTNGGIQSMTYISESNLYKCVFQSRKPEAEKFQDWVCEEVLPSIRKNGLYATELTIDRMIDNPEFGIKLLTQLKEEREARKLAQMQLERANASISKNAPKVEYFDNVLQSTETLTTTQVAKAMGRTAVWLNRQLKKCGLLFYQSGQWMLKSPYDRCELHKVRTSTYTKSDGTIASKSSTVWTEKGKRFILALNDCSFKLSSAVAIMRQEQGKGGVAV